MKRFYSFRVVQNFLQALCLTVLFAVSSAYAQVDKPIASVTGDTFDFGSVRQGEKVTHDFVIENKGNAPLQIQHIEPSCGCTVAEVTANEIPPGGNATVKVTFDTKGFWGGKEKTVRVYTSDQANTSVLLTLKGDIRRDISVHPGRVSFGTLRKGQIVTEDILVVFEDVKPIEIKAITSPSQLIKLEISPYVSEGRVGKRVRVSLDASKAQVGLFESRISIESNSSEVPMLIVPLFARIVGDLEIEPAEFYFGLNQLPFVSKPSKTIKIINRGAEDIKILDVKSADPNVSVSVSESVPGREYILSATVENARPGNLQSFITLHTNHTDTNQRSITIPVGGLFSPRQENAK